MNTLLPFSYGDQPVRVVSIDGEPWFVLADLCKVLDLTQPNKVALRIADDMKGRNRIPTPGGDQEMTVVSEAGMYEVVIRSDKPEAAAFRRWITTEVLPSIRKRGGYLTPEATEAALTDPDFIIRLATELKVERAQRAELAAQSSQQQARLRLVEPKAAAFDRWLSSNVDYSVGHVAKALAVAGAANVGRTRLFVRLAELRWIYRESGSWTPFQTQIDTGRLAVKLGSQLNTRTGEQFATVTVRVTPKGAAKLAVLYGVMPETVADALATTTEEGTAA